MKVQRILFQGNINRIEDLKLVKKVTDLNPIGVIIKRPTKNRWRDEVINDLKKKTKTEKLEPNPQRLRSLE